MVLNWKTSKAEFDTIACIADRAAVIAKENGIKYSVRDALMDITAVHANGCPLRLAELADAPSGDFMHDVFGIRRHLNRDTGKLEDCFAPRFAQPEKL